MKTIIATATLCLVSFAATAQAAPNTSARFAKEVRAQLKPLRDWDKPALAGAVGVARRKDLPAPLQKVFTSQRRASDAMSVSKTNIGGRTVYVFDKAIFLSSGVGLERSAYDSKANKIASRVSEKLE